MNGPVSKTPDASRIRREAREKVTESNTPKALRKICVASGSDISLIGRNVRGLLFQQFSTHTVRYEKVVFEDVTFYEANVSAFVAEGCVFKRCKWHKCEFSEIQIVDCEFYECTFDRVQITSAAVRHSSADQLTFDACAIGSLHVDGGDFVRNTLAACEVNELRIESAALDKLVISDCQALSWCLSSVKVGDAVLFNSRFGNCLFASVRANNLRFGNSEIVNCTFDDIQAQQFAVLDSRVTSTLITQISANVLHLTRSTFGDSEWLGLKVSVANFDKLSQTNCRWVECNVDSLQAAEMILSDASFKHCDFRAMQIPESQWNSCHWEASTAIAKAAGGCVITGGNTRSVIQLPQLSQSEQRCLLWQQRNHCGLQGYMEQHG